MPQCVVCEDGGTTAMMSFITSDGLLGVDTHLCQTHQVEFDALADGRECIVEGCPEIPDYGMQETPGGATTVRYGGGDPPLIPVLCRPHYELLKEDPERVFDL